MSSVQIEAEVLPVAKDMFVRRGEHVLVVAGVCVGVYTGAIVEAQAEDKPTIKLEADIMAITEAIVGEAAQKAEDLDSRRVNAESVSMVLQDAGAYFTSQEIADALGLRAYSQGGQSVRRKLSRVLSAMHTEGTILRQGEQNNYSYKLKPKRGRPAAAKG